jgi:heptosyltransferase-2
MQPTGNPHKNPRVLVVAPNWLGDLVMSTVLLEAIARLGLTGAGTDIGVTLAVRRRWLPLVAADPRVATLLLYQREGMHHGWRGLFRLAASWRAAGCETAILLPPSLRVAITARLAGIRRRFGRRSDGRGFLLTDRVTLPPRGTLHYCEEVLRIGRAWLDGLAHDPADAAWDRQITQLQPTLPGCDGVPPDPDAGQGPPLWILAPGATYGAAKTWPVQQAADFVTGAVTQMRVRVALLGDTSGRDLAARLRQGTGDFWRDELPGDAGAVDLVGRTDLSRVVALLKAAAIFVGSDSGLMHLAAALGTPTLGLFGSTNPVWTGPRGRRTAVLAASGFDCQPCYRRRCNQRTFCLATLTGEQVLTAAQRLLEQDHGQEATL